MGRCVLSMGGFVVLKGGHYGVFGWLDYEGVRVLEFGGLEHFIVVDVFLVYLKGKVLVDWLNLVLEEM